MPQNRSTSLSISFNVMHNFASHLEMVILRAYFMDHNVSPIIWLSFNVNCIVLTSIILSWQGKDLPLPLKLIFFGKTTNILIINSNQHIYATNGHHKCTFVWWIIKSHHLSHISHKI